MWDDYPYVQIENVGNHPICFSVTLCKMEMLNINKEQENNEDFCRSEAYLTKIMFACKDFHRCRQKSLEVRT